jgi:lipoprotein-releasing system permease protein
MTKLELAIAWRYLRSRRVSRLLTLIRVIAIVGVIIVDSALIVINGEMNGLHSDIR